MAPHNRTLLEAYEGLAQQCFHRTNNLALHVRQYMAVSVEGNCDRRMFEQLLHDLGMHALAQQQRRTRMPEIVKAYGAGYILHIVECGIETL